VSNVCTSPLVGRRDPRCLGTGHQLAKCPGKDRSKCCRKCGEEGHQANACKGQQRCFLCLDKGEKDVEHASGSNKCPHTRKRTASRTTSESSKTDEHGGVRQRRRCPKCLRYGHPRKVCPGPDRTNTCRNCGEEGHKADSCKNEPLCLACADAGHDDTHHVGGSQRCREARAQEAGLTQEEPDNAGGAN
jgi:hypothetical protein